MPRLAGSPVMAMVFYEALCPDSKHFILRQLVPTFIKAPTLIDFQLVPYGKATVNFLTFNLLPNRNTLFDKMFFFRLDQYKS